MPFLLNHKSRGILIGTVGAVFQTGLDQFWRVWGFFRILIDQTVFIVLQRTDLHLSEIRDAGAIFPFKIWCKTMLIPDYGPRTSDVCVKSLIVTLRKRPTSEIRGPQTVGVIGQHNTAHEIPKIHKSLVSKLEPWVPYSKPDRCLFFLTTNLLES